MSLPATRRSIAMATPTPKKLPRGMRMHSNYFHPFGPKVGRLVDCYSSHEWRFFHLLEADPNVRTYCEEFPEIDESVNGKKLKYTFDFWVHYVDGTEELIEIKPVDKLARNKLGEPAPKRWDDICDWCARQPIACRFVTDEEIDQHSLRIENWTQILPQVQRGVKRKTDDLIERIEGAVRARSVRVIGDLPRNFPDIDVETLQDLLFVLLHRGQVRMNLDTGPLTLLTTAEVVDERPANN